jgi:hypothetical protein
MIEIPWVGMTRQHFEPGEPGRIRMVVLHATAGRGPGDLNWLRKGGDERRPVSVHYYIAKDGAASQLVDDEDIAWHAGRSRWTVDGRMAEGLNAVSVGIELENLNTGRDPYPEAQYTAAVELTRYLVRRYNVPRGQLVRHLDISPGRKTDPAGFPWARFVADVFADEAAGESRAERLRALMLDQAYRAAGGALPDAWPLFDVARQRGLGMPIAALAGRPSPAGSAQDDRDRAVRLPGLPPMLVEVYARDLLYAPLAGSGDDAPAAAQAKRLAETPPGPLRDALLGLLFRAADPVSGFQPGWAFHRHYLEHAERLGAPIGPSHRVKVGQRQAFSCQHFALDTLCSPVGSWQTVYRLSELAGERPGLDRNLAAALRRALLDDLYRAKAARRYDPAALLSRHAEQHALGAPLGRPERLLVDGETHLIMPFALDVLACALPEPTWPLERAVPAGTPVLALSTLGAAPTVLGASAGGGIAAIRGSLRRLLGRHHGEEVPADAGPCPTLGPAAGQPPFFDLSDYARGRRGRSLGTPDVVLIATAPGPCADDLQNDRLAAGWHYYVDTTGAVYRLRGDAYAAAPEGGEGDAPLAERAIVVAVEGGAAYAGPDQRRALAWLVRTLTAGLNLSPEQVRALPERRPQPTPGHPAIV